jgi:hypothetical protein
VTVATSARTHTPGDAERWHPRVADGGINSLVATNRRQTTALDEDRFAELFDTFEVSRFG